jgi:hypothetical protein
MDAKTKDKGQRTKDKQIGGFPVLFRPLFFVLCLLLIGLVGCNMETNNGVDPLTNGPPIPRNPQQTNAAGTTGNTRSGNGGTPGPLPVNGGPANSNSPAALATVNQGGNGGEQVPAKSTGGGVEVVWHGEGGKEAVKANGAESERGNVAAIRTVGDVQTRLGGPQTLDANRVDTYQAAQEALAARGVTWQRLETRGDQGEWKFTCSIPDPKVPNVLRRYEAQAVGEHGVAAIRLVIRKIDEEQQQ